MAEQRRRCLALTPGAVGPVGRRGAEHGWHFGQERRNRAEPMVSGAQAIADRCEVAGDQAEHTENGLTGPQRWVGVHEVPALLLGESDLERPVRQRQIHLPGEDRDLGVGYATGRVEVAAQRPHLVGRVRETVGRPVGQHGVVRVEPGEGR